MITFALQKFLLRKCRQATDYEKICTKHTFDEGYYSKYMINSCNSTITRQFNLKKSKYLNRQFIKEDINGNMNMKISSTLLMIRKIQNKNTKRYHYTPTGMAKIKNTQCW